MGLAKPSSICGLTFDSLLYCPKFDKDSDSEYFQNTCIGRKVLFPEFLLLTLSQTSPGFYVSAVHVV